MSVVSVNIPERVGISVSESPVGIPAPEKSPDELAGYRVSMPNSDAAEKMHRPNLGKRPKTNLDATGIKCLFEF